MKAFILTYLSLSLSLPMKATQDSLNTHVQVDTIEVYNSDSCLALITVINNGVIHEKRMAILTWYKTKLSKEYRKENDIKKKYGFQLDLVNHGERIQYLEEGQLRISSYELGYLVESQLINSDGTELPEMSGFGLRENASSKFYCEKDILYVLIIGEYGFPKRIRNKRKSRY